MSIKKILAPLIAILICSNAIAATCKRCHYTFTGTKFPAYSKPLLDALTFTTKRLKIKLSKNEVSALQKILKRENSSGSLHAKNPKSSAFGLPQVLRGTYRGVGVPYGIICPSCQLEVMLKYVGNRYGTFHQASRHWDRHRYY